MEKTIGLVVNGIQQFHESRSHADLQEVWNAFCCWNGMALHSSCSCVYVHQIHIVLPTISAVKERVDSRLRTLSCDIPVTIVTDLDARLRTELFQVRSPSLGCYREQIYSDASWSCVGKRCRCGCVWNGRDGDGTREPADACGVPSESAHRDHRQAVGGCSICLDPQSIAW